MTRDIRWSPIGLPAMRRGLIDAQATLARNRRRDRDALAATADQDPKLRAHGLGALADAYAEAREVDVDALERENRLLAVTSLYWVTPDMTRLAVEAATTLPNWSARDAAPDDHGLLVWATPIAHARWDGAPDGAREVNVFGQREAPVVSVDGMWWSTVAGRVTVRAVTRVDDATRRHLGPSSRGAPLFATTAVRLHPDGLVRGDDHNGSIHVLGATWMLMQQPTLAEARPAEETRGDGRPPRRPEQPVTLIDLRRVERPGRERDPDARPVDWSCRWLVEGHWHTYRVGPGRARIERRYVPTYEKGPTDRPLRIRDHVAVWRR